MKIKSQISPETNHLILKDTFPRRASYFVTQHSSQSLASKMLWFNVVASTDEQKYKIKFKRSGSFHRNTPLVTPADASYDLAQEEGHQ